MADPLMTLAERSAFNFGLTIGFMIGSIMVGIVTVMFFAWPAGGS